MKKTIKWKNLIKQWKEKDGYKKDYKIKQAISDNKTNISSKKMPLTLLATDYWLLITSYQLLVIGFG